MNGLGGYYAKWNKPNRERKVLYGITYLWNLKTYNKLVNITKRKQTHRYGEETSGYQWGDRKGEDQHRGRGLRGTNYYI